MTILFWTTILLLLYVYIGYPLLLQLLGTLAGRERVDWRMIEPKVTFFISAFNEEAVIRDKVLNSLSIDYPSDKLEMIVVSDCSTDRTDAIVREFAGQGVILHRMEERRGKTWGLNASVPLASGEVLIFSDANALYRPDAIQKLVRNFNDPRVGCVAGESRYVKTQRSQVGEQENLYWDYERRLKLHETWRGSMVGADGAIFAIRKHLYEPLDAGDINDFVTPLQIVKKGFRCIYEPEAVCEEQGTVRYREEFRRKIRIVNRSVYALRKMKNLLNPFRHGWFSIQLFSHKVLRWCVPLWLGGLFASSLALAGAGTLYRGLLFAQSAFYLFALSGVLLSRLGTPRLSLLTLPYYFCMVNLAALIGLIRSFSGQVQVTWSPERGDRSAILNAPPVSRRAPQMAFVAIALALAIIATARDAAVLAAWASLGALVYVYAGYPLLIWLFAHRRTQPATHQDSTPTVTLLITAYNEEDVILEKLKNSLALDYPQEQLKIIVASDGSTDRTNQIVEVFHAQGIELIDFPCRRGKSSAIADAMERIRTEIVLFSDANVMYEPSAVKTLVRNFADASVGLVSGRVQLINHHLFYRGPENYYYQYEEFLQRQEAVAGTMLGADGAMFAIRRELFRPPSAAVILDDFVIAMSIVRQGKRVVFEPDAVGLEASSPNALAEFERRSRVVAGAVQSIYSGEGVPRRDQLFQWFQYLSHKVLRWLTPFFLVWLLIASLVLIREPFYQTILAAQATFYGLALYGAVTRRPRLINALPFYFCMVNTAAAAGLYRGLGFQQVVRWKKHGRMPIEASMESGSLEHLGIAVKVNKKP